MYMQTRRLILGGCKMFNLCMELHDAIQKMSYIFIFYWCMYKWVFVDCNCIFLKKQCNYDHNLCWSVYRRIVKLLWFLLHNTCKIIWWQVLCVCESRNPSSSIRARFDGWIQGVGWGSHHAWVFSNVQGKAIISRFNTCSLCNGL